MRDISDTVYHTSVSINKLSMFILAHTKREQTKLAVAQTEIERSMLNITYSDRRTNIWVRERAKVTDIIQNAREKTVLGRTNQSRPI